MITQPTLTMIQLTRRRHRGRGFAYMDLLVMSVVVAILAALAVPSFREFAIREQRLDAQRALAELAARMERRREATGRYARTLAELGHPALSPEGAYALSIDAGATTATFFQLTATARARQIGDEQCRTLTLTSTGLRKAYNASRGDTSHVCWRG